MTNAITSSIMPSEHASAIADLIADSSVDLLSALRVLDGALRHPPERQLNSGHQRELPIDAKLDIAVCELSRSEARSLQSEVDSRAVEVHGACPRRREGVSTGESLIAIFG